MNDTSGFDPIFIGGAGRSGTTLLRAMLASHSSLAGTNEFKLLPNIADIRRMFSAYSDVSEHYQLSENYLDQQLAVFIESLFTPFLEQQGGLRLIEKTPHNILAADVLLRVFPKSKMLHVIRDGRDVAMSLVNMNWSDGNGKVWYTRSVADAANYWQQIIRSTEVIKQDPLIAERLKVIRYESLVHDPKKKLQAVLKWFDLGWEEAILDDSQRENMMAQEINESSTEQVAQSINNKAIGRWQTQMSVAQRREFHQVAGDLLIELGYVKNDTWITA